MDDFLTPVEQDIREKVRGLLRPGRGLGPAEQGRDAGPAGAGRLWEAVGLPAGGGRGPGPHPGLLGRALVVEEVSAASPKLGRALLAAWPDRSRTGEAAGELAWAIGSTAAALGAGLDAARKKGLFQSTLMGHQRAQGDLADTLAAVQALRLRAYRALRLIEKGENVRGEDELGRAAGEAAAVRDRARATLGALLGEAGLAELMPEDERSGR